MTARLPSYQEATARPDWLRLAAPYIDFADYCALCLVDRRCWRIFAPLLWTDVLKSARLSGLPPWHDSVWWPRFVFQRLSHVAPATRSLVRVLDLRDFARDFQGLALQHTSGLMQQSLKRALELLPGVRSLLLDGHVYIDPCILAILELNDSQPALLQLSVRGCSANLSKKFLHSPCLRNLVFLDISGPPESIGCMLCLPGLPSLRILKVRDKEINDRTGTVLAYAVGRRLWSLDLGGNKLTDSIIEALLKACMPMGNLRSPARFQMEGKLVRTSYGTQQHGSFLFLRDSPSSESFSHPERYLVDAPRYRLAALTEETPLGYHEARRSDCRSPPRLDCADPVSQLLLCDLDPLAGVDHSPASRGGITHLSLSGNEVSAFGIDKLFRESGGHLSYFACDRMPLLPLISACSRVWPRSARLYGIMGMEHVFRPVYASNLQVLRLHHSIVTNIPSLEMDGLSKPAGALVAETLILPRVDQASPLTLIPDTNPRLTSLTLTCIPQKSSGPLIERLIGFLRLLSMQECAVRDTRQMIASCRASDVLRGLRHLRLEFEPEAPFADLSAIHDYNELDAAALLDSGDAGFSFFDFRGGAAGPPRVGARTSGRSSSAKAGESRPADQDDRETVRHSLHWNAKTFSLQVWAGTPSLASSNAHIREYRRLVLGCNVREGVGPVTPGQIRAGAPGAGYIFQKTWSMAVMPREIAAPTATEVANMKSVVDALCEYRQEGLAKLHKAERELGNGRVPPGAPHWYWRGKLEVCLVQEDLRHHQDDSGDFGSRA